MSGRLRVLIIDDSSVMRMMIRSVLSRTPGIEVVGVASDGLDGIEKSLSLVPDLITMEINLPGKINGISALKQIMTRRPTQVLIVSSLTCEGAQATFDALDAGAVDYVYKIANPSPEALQKFQEVLLAKVLEVSRKNKDFRPEKVVNPRHVVVPMPVIQKPQVRRITCVGIGASTGGPVAVQEVLARIPANFPYGIVVVVHMPQTFTGAYASRLNTKCALKVREAVDGAIVRGGEVLVAPGGSHTILVREGGNTVVRIVPTSAYPDYNFIPSVDLMMSTLCDATGGSMLGVILTGMGNDGYKGLAYLKQKGGSTIVQNEETSTIYGMPRACIEGKVADVVLPLEQIGVEIAKYGN